MIAGPKPEQSNPSSQSIWLARCITQLLTSDAGKAMSIEFARHEAHELWRLCGDLLTPEQAAERWLVDDRPC